MLTSAELSMTRRKPSPVVCEIAQHHPANVSMRGEIRCLCPGGSRYLDTFLSPILKILLRSDWVLTYP